MTRAPKLPSKIAIAGPGRSGTSLLVKILSTAGLSTPGSDTEYDEVNAGRESRIGIGSPFDVDKDPWLYEYAENLSDEAWSEYRALVIPIRNLTDASVSRSKNERVARIVENPELDHWRWDSWGPVPGGAVSATDARAIGEVLSTGLWTLITVATTKKIPIVLLNFPEFARDADYLWTQLGPHLPEHITREVLLDAWNQTVRPELAREYASDGSGPGVVELREMVEDLARRISLVKNQHTEATTALGERTLQVDELTRIVAETQAELAQAHRDAVAQSDRRISEINNAVASLSEVVAQSDRRIAEVNQRLDHLFVVVERSSQPFLRKLVRFVRNRFRPSK